MQTSTARRSTCVGYVSCIPQRLKHAYTSLMSADRTANFLRRLEERRRSLSEEIEDDIAPLRGLTLEERGEILESVCRDAMAILRARPDFQSALAHEALRKSESLDTWRIRKGSASCLDERS